MKLTEFAIIVGSLFTACDTFAVTCYQTPVQPGEIVNAPAGNDMRLVFMVPQREDEIGKITLYRNSTPVAETVIFHTPGEPAEYGLEGDHGVFVGSTLHPPLRKGEPPSPVDPKLTAEERAKLLYLLVDTGIFAVNRNQDILVLHPGARSRVQSSRYTLKMMTGTDCTRLYPDQGKVSYE